MTRRLRDISNALRNFGAMLQKLFAKPIYKERTAVKISLYPIKVGRYTCG